MDNKFLGFVLGVILGSAVGAGAAFLLAPASGEELRGQIVDRYQTVRSNVEQAATERRAELEKQLAELRAPRKPAPPDNPT
jgi:gas vesicle protein